MVHGAAGSTVEGTNKHYWSPAQEGRDFEFSDTLSRWNRCRDYITIVSDTDLNPATARVAGRRGRRSFPLERRVPHRRASEDDRRLRLFCGHLHRPALRAEVRPGHAAALHPALHRDGGRLGRLRLRLCVRLRRYHQLGLADAAAADDPRSAHGVRKPVRRWRHAAGAAGAQQGESQHPGLDLARCEQAAKGSGPQRSPAPEQLSRRRARDRAAHPENREVQFQRRSSRPAGRASGRARFVRRARQADVRSAGAGLHDRRHPRFGLQDEPRRERPRVAGKRREDAIPHLLASRRNARRASPNSPNSTGITSAWFRTSWRN